MGLCGCSREGLEINGKSILNDRHGALVIYPENVNDIQAFAEDKVKRVLKTDAHVPVEEYFSHTLPSGQNIVIAIFPFKKQEIQQRRRL